MLVDGIVMSLMTIASKPRQVCQDKLLQVSGYRARAPFRIVVLVGEVYTQDLNSLWFSGRWIYA
jgi:hypothetical protein